MTVAPMAELFSLTQANPCWPVPSSRHGTTARGRSSTPPATRRPGPGAETRRALPPCPCRLRHLLRQSRHGRVVRRLRRRSFSRNRWPFFASTSSIRWACWDPASRPVVGPPAPRARIPACKRINPLLRPPLHRSVLTWPLLYRLGKFSYRHRWLVISLWLAVLVAVGGSAAAFHGTMSNNFRSPARKPSRWRTSSRRNCPHASGGSASIVFDAGDARFSQAGKDAVSAALTKLASLPDVQGTVDPFATQAQLDKAAADIAAGEAEGRRRQGPAGRGRRRNSPRARPSWRPPNSR